MYIADAAWIPSCCGSGNRPAATAPIRPLAWEPPYAAGAAQEMAKRQKKKKKNCPPVSFGVTILIHTKAPSVLTTVDFAPSVQMSTQ